MPNWHTLLFDPSPEPRATPRGTPGLPPGFRTTVDQVARRLGMDPEHLLTVMRFETGGTFSPSIRNQAGSGATGLIQFMPATARGLGTTTEALAGMSPEQQLDYVERYLRPYRGRMRSLQDAYAAVLYPAAVGQPASHVLFRQGSRAYAQNKGLDVDRSGTVTMGEARRAVERRQGAPPAEAPGRDWGRELFSTTTASTLPEASQYASSGARDWGQALFG